MTQQTQIHIDKNNLAQAEAVVSDLPELGAGEVLLEIESFALTANNITYAVMGEQMKYWNFFPSGDDGKGILPMWGHAKVAASGHDNFAVGERLYGYLPMGSHLVVQPGKISDGGFMDMAPHRHEMSPLYSQYRRLAADPAHHPDFEDERSLFSPLFATSFLIEDMFRRAEWHGADALVMTSASSKTAMALAHVARASSPGIKRIGLTSAGNVEFTRNLGFYDEVVAYGAVDTLDADVRTVSVDFAGNGEVLAAIHSHFDSNLAFSSLVGATHVDARGGAQGLAGPAPILFFAPTAMQELIAEIGPAGFAEAMAGRWNGFVKDVAGQVTAEQIDGAGAIRDAYREMLAGKVAPTRGLMCSF
ncbi:DUF2855 family protein [Sphingorhabdus sp. Alg239-R122]|uniref:DUF2855 family protein n=1 Tax=Sphingorhabdus sp. Alg239-R122 TaxID=2305989 RepID=UPI0013DA8BB6|nr:DUF2855 family protein [Sphingorhabdus sp. Alg239-R122]